MNEIPEWARNAISIPNPGAVSKKHEVLAEDGEDVSAEIFTLDGVQFPRVAGARIRAMDSEERAAWDADRLRCKTDPIYLSEIMGLDLVENPHRYLFDQFLKMKPGVPLHELDTVKKKRMVLWSRGHFKTVSVRVFETQAILNYPDIRICFLTGSDDLAKRQLSSLKGIFERPTERFKYLFPEYVFVSRQNKKTKIWSDYQDEMGSAHEFVVPARVSTVFAEPTFWISTAKTTKAGSHADIIVVDDLVNEVNSRSAPQLEKSYQDYLAIVPVLDPLGYIICTGTRYSFGDAYERIMENAQEAGESSVWKFSVQGCYSEGNCKNCQHPEVAHDRNVNILQPPCTSVGCQCKGFESDGCRGVLFPQVDTRDGRRKIGFTFDMLEKIKAELGPQNFANQYLNKPLAAETQVFTETLIGGQTIHDVNLVPGYQAGATFVIGDLAYGDEATSDWSVLYACRQYQSRLYVFQCLAGRWQSHELVSNIIKILLDPTVRPQAMYLEKTLGTTHLLDLVTARANQIGLQRLPIQLIKTNQRKGAKGLRISNIQEALKSKRLWLFAGMPYYQDLVNQLVKFPRTKKDDFADCLGLAVELGAAAYSGDSGPQVESVTNWLRKLHAPREGDDAYPDTGGGNGLCC